MWICLVCLRRPVSWSVAMCEESIVIPYGSLADILVDIITGAVLVVDTGISLASRSEARLIF